MTKEQEIDINLLIATFRCFNEQLYLLKGTHSQILKRKFNRLIKVARQYDDELNRIFDYNEDLESVYDLLMDVIIEVKKQANEG